jgi:hypothetical protein
MNDWRIVIKLYWPHDRFMFGWQLYRATEEDPYDTFELGLGFISIDFDIESSNF